MPNSILGAILYIIFYIGLIYYLLIGIFFLLTWIEPLYYTKIFRFFETISRPFLNLVSNKLILGNLDIGTLIGMIIFGFLLKLIANLAYMF